MSLQDRLEAPTAAGGLRVETDGGVRTIWFVDAAEALRIGLVQHVLPRTEVLAAATACARELATRCSPAAMAVIRQQVWTGLEATADQATADAARLMAESLDRPDLVEALTALAERRPPSFGPAPAAPIS